jgi:hypothetical protein
LYNLRGVLIYGLQLKDQARIGRQADHRLVGVKAAAGIGVRVRKITLRLVSAVLIEIDDAWQTGRVYLTFESNEPTPEP